jgi:hypothetical protein
VLKDTIQGNPPDPGNPRTSSKKLVFLSKAWHLSITDPLQAMNIHGHPWMSMDIHEQEQEQERELLLLTRATR